MLARITYGTFLVFGSACIVMVVYAVLCVPETKGVPLESIYMLFEGNIIAGATRDVVPRFSRAKHLANSSNEGRYRDDEGEDDNASELKTKLDSLKRKRSDGPAASKGRKKPSKGGAKTNIEYEYEPQPRQMELA